MSRDSAAAGTPGPEEAPAAATATPDEAPAAGTAGPKDVPTAGTPEPKEAAAASPAREERSTSRFPSVTQDTARPEGGGRAASGAAPAPARQWPVLAVLMAVGTGLLLTAFGLFRGGTLLIGLALIAGAALRWALPSVGMLAVRSRFTDMITYGVLGVAIALLAMMAQPHPWLQIPFLDDALHFTIS